MADDERRQEDEAAASPVAGLAGEEEAPVAVRPDDIVQYDRSVPSFLQQTEEATRWLEGFAQRLRSKRIGREEIAWVLGVSTKNISQAVPSSCDAAFKGKMLSDMSFVARGTGCVIKGVIAKPYLNGRKATLVRDLHTSSSHAVVLVEGGIKEKLNDGDRSKTLSVGREHLMFAAHAEECNASVSMGWPSLHLLPVSRLAEMQEIDVDGSRPSMRCKPEELLGAALKSKTYPSHLKGSVGQKWLANAIGRLVDARRCCPEDLAFLIGVAGPHGGEPAGLGGPHVKTWPAASQVGLMLTDVDFVPSYATVMIQDSDRDDLNGRLAEVWDPCPTGKFDVRVSMVGDEESVMLPRKHLRLLPAPGPVLQLGMVPFGTRCIIEGSSTRSDLNGRRVMVLEDCRAGQAHCRVFGEGLREIRVHRKNLCVARPDPRVPFTPPIVSETEKAIAHRFNRTGTVGSLESGEDTPMRRLRSKGSVFCSEEDAEAGVAGLETVPSSPATTVHATAPENEETLINNPLGATPGNKMVISLGDTDTLGDDTSDTKRVVSKEEIIDVAKKGQDGEAEDTDALVDAKEKEQREKAGSDRSKEDVDSLRSFGFADKEAIGITGFLGGFWSLWGCASTDRGCAASCCAKDYSQEMNVEGSNPSLASPLMGEDLELESIHPSLAPMVETIGVAEAAPIDKDAAGPEDAAKDESSGPFEKEHSLNGSNAPTREPAPSTAAGDTPTSGGGTPIASRERPSAGGQQIHATGDTEAPMPQPPMATQVQVQQKAKRKGFLSRVMGRGR